MTVETDCVIIHQKCSLFSPIKFPFAPFLAVAYRNQGRWAKAEHLEAKTMESMANFDSTFESSGPHLQAIYLLRGWRVDRPAHPQAVANSKTLLR